MTRYSLLATLLFCFAFVGIHPSQGQELVPPRNLDELKKTLTTEMERQHVAGMILTIATKDSVLCSTGLGFSDIDKKQPVTENQLFRGSSITKLFVALAILNLVQEKKLTLQTRLKDIAPDIHFRNDWETTHPVTIAQLLEHTTGFSDKSPFQEYNFSSHTYTSAEALNVFEKFRVARWKPGERHAYSSVNYAVLADIIERISGKSVDAYLREKVFSKFDMPFANLNLTDDGTTAYSKGYVWKGGKFQLVPHQPAFSSSYSSLNVSAVDFAQALRMYLNDWTLPSGTFLSKQILADSETPHTYLSAQAGLKNTYAFGNESHDQGGVTFRGHRGAIGGFLSTFLYNREHGVGYAFALNTHNEGFYRFADQLISQYLLLNHRKSNAEKKIPLNQKAVLPYLGYYRYANPSQLYTGFFEALTNTVQVSPGDGFLNARIIGRGGMKWLQTDVSGRFFRNENASFPHISFLQDSDGNLAISDGTMYLEKISAWQAWTSILFFIVSALLLLSAFFFGLVNWVLFIFNKNIRKEWQLRLSPALATLALLVSLFVISQLFDHMKEASPMNGLHTAWILGNCGFLLFSLVSWVLLATRWKAVSSVPLKFYLSFVTAAGVYITVLLWANHWFL